MENENMESTPRSIKTGAIVDCVSRQMAVETLLHFAADCDPHTYSKPAAIARQCAEIIQQIPTVSGERVIRGKIAKTFYGTNVTFGVCSRCGHSLIWYTDNPINGCPYCFMRERKGIITNGADHDALRTLPVDDGKQQHEAEAAPTHPDHNEEA